MVRGRRRVRRARLRDLPLGRGLARVRGAGRALPGRPQGALRHRGGSTSRAGAGSSTPSSSPSCSRCSSLGSAIGAGSPHARRRGGRRAGWSCSSRTRSGDGSRAREGSRGRRRASLLLCRRHARRSRLRPDLRARAPYGHLAAASPGLGVLGVFHGGLALARRCGGAEPRARDRGPRRVAGVGYLVGGLPARRPGSSRSGSCRASGGSAHRRSQRGIRSGALARRRGRRASSCSSRGHSSWSAATSRRLRRREGSRSGRESRRARRGGSPSARPSPSPVAPSRRARATSGRR